MGTAGAWTRQHLRGKRGVHGRQRTAVSPRSDTRQTAPRANLQINVNPTCGRLTTAGEPGGTRTEFLGQGAARDKRGPGGMPRDCNRRPHRTGEAEAIGAISVDR